MLYERGPVIELTVVALTTASNSELLRVGHVLLRFHLKISASGAFSLGTAVCKYKLSELISLELKDMSDVEWGFSG